jgi:TPR repeat protein
MSLLGSFGWGRRRAAEEAAQRRVAALQTALDRCNASARRSADLRRKVMGAVAVSFLALGFASGVHEPILQTARYVAANLGIYADDANAAYQKGDSASPLTQAHALAGAGDARAQLTVALRYYRGRGETRDNKEAAKWFRSAADQGDAAAPFYLGIMSAEGEGVPQNHAEAAKWFRLAADRGNPEAQYNLGLAYATGIGVTPDEVSAHMWLNLAAAGFPASDTGKRSDAAHNREAVAGKMTPAQVAEAQRLASAWRAAADVRVAADNGAHR